MRQIEEYFERVTKLLSIVGKMLLVSEEVGKCVIKSVFRENHKYSFSKYQGANDDGHLWKKEAGMYVEKEDFCV